MNQTDISERIFIASDHAGFQLKRYLVEQLNALPWVELIDLGTHDKAPCDYPIFANRLVKKLLIYPDSYGILICGTGIGMSVAANRFEDIRAALCLNKKMAEMARRHNDANVIVFGATLVDNETALSCVRCFVSMQFDGGRHARRLSLINSLSKDEED